MRKNKAVKARSLKPISSDEVLSNAQRAHDDIMNEVSIILSNRRSSDKVLRSSEIFLKRLESINDIFQNDKREVVNK